ncbi:hypothetical protein [Mucilaginibacter sp.]|uniref:hypothetical protein n=1 Tax=Mucilaginibacter sp. TaxID=1882438 RepID=UPI00284D7E5D|nr:hypothetical protein [Mucilaginibacter sp.]MDR3694618.1 hypothetical protein [Mucilaginibacter sp.]
MKSFYILPVILLFGSIFSSCKKAGLATLHSTGNTTNTTKPADTLTKWPAVPIDSALLVGNWQVINDTSLTVPFFTNNPSMGKNYIGKPSDYYKFIAGGRVYTCVAGTVDTGNYVINKNIVNIVYTYFNGQHITGGIYNSQWSVYHLTAQTAIITTTFVNTLAVTTSITSLKR